MRRWWVLPSLLVPLSIANVAHADDDCPPGSWFCEDVDVPKPEIDDADADAEAEPGEPAAEPAPAAKPKKKKKAKKKKKKTKRVEVEGDADTVIVVDDDTDKVVVVEKTARPAPPPAPKPAKKRRRWAEKFGLNLRLEGAAFPAAEGVHEDVGMGGVGASFRWRPSPYFAFDLGTDVLGGNDYYGHERVEVSGALSGIVYFNPQHRVQVYGIGGINLSHAWIDTDADYYYDAYYDEYLYEQRSDVEHDYFGGHGGLGVEFRIARHIALHVDALALIRHKIDDSPPEFTDGLGNTTDTSGAGLFRAGVIFWW